MGKLLNKATGNRDVIDDADMAAARASGKYAEPDAVAVHSQGEDVYATPDVASSESVYAPAVAPSKAALASGHTAREKANTGAAATVRSAVGGLVSGGTVGLVNPYESEQEFNPTASTLGQIGGMTLLGGAGRIGEFGAALAERAGGGVIGGIVGGAGEGGIYGVGNAVSELARSDEPLTAEHIASTLSSNVLLGAGLGGVTGGLFKAGERALSRAGDALAGASKARAAIEGMPAELAGLDETGLKAASVTAKAEHAADIAAERQSLEGLRVDQRAKLADQIRDLHSDLATERPIFHAVNADEVANIEGVSDIKVQLAKSYKAMRSGLDSEISVARDPSSMIRPLEMRQAALQKLQAKAPELQAALAGDARSAVLDHVDDALEQTKAQIESIRQLSKSNPVASGRLTMLEAGPSPKMAAIEDARTALKAAPEIGLLQKGATSAAFAGGTALAHMIPGVGIAAPFLGKAAADMVGKLFGHLAGSVDAVAGKTAAAAKSFLSVAEKAVPVAAMTATKVLGAVRYGVGPEAKSSRLPDLFDARSAELRAQTMYAPDGSVQMRPEARIALGRQLAAIFAVNPILADKIETAAARRITFVSSKIPRRPDVLGMQIGPDNWHPSDLAMRSFARTCQAAEDPHGVELRLAAGNLTPEDAEAYRTCYPERFEALQQHLVASAPMLAKTLPYQRRLSWSIFAGVPIDPSLAPNVRAVLRGSFSRPAPDTTADIPGMQAPKIQPSFGSLGSMKSLDKPTPAERRSSS